MNADPKRLMQLQERLAGLRGNAPATALVLEMTVFKALLSPTG